MTMNIFQVTEADVRRSMVLDPNDIGLWCFKMNGCICGFAETREAAEDMLTRHALHHAAGEVSWVIE